MQLLPEDACCESKLPDGHFGRDFWKASSPYKSPVNSNGWIVDDEDQLNQIDDQSHGP